MNKEESGGVTEAVKKKARPALTLRRAGEVRFKVARRANMAFAKQLVGVVKPAAVARAAHAMNGARATNVSGEPARAGKVVAVGALYSLPLVSSAVLFTNTSGNGLRLSCSAPLPFYLTVWVRCDLCRRRGGTIYPLAPRTCWTWRAWLRSGQPS